MYLGFLKTVQPNSFSKFTSILFVNLNNNTQETSSFVLKLLFCPLDSNFLAKVKFHKE